MRNSIKGILLIDRGSPTDLSQNGLKKYYQKILNDTFYTQWPQWLRKILIQYWILPMNLNQWRKKYRRFWSSKGFVGCFDMCQNIDLLKKMLTKSSPEYYWVVELASIYGPNSIEKALQKMKSGGIQELLIIPLFPQWSQPSRGLAEVQIKDYINKKWIIPYHILESFYHYDDILHAQSELLNKSLPEEINDSVAVVSAFRNELAQNILQEIPVCKKCLRTNEECRSISSSRFYCYRYQCFDTAQLINERCNLMYWNVAFHSSHAQFAHSKGPSLQEVTEHLLEQGFTTMVVQCPSIIYNDIETLNDINFELREYFLNNGGQKFILVPPLGHSVHWLSILQKIILSHLDASSLPHLVQEISAVSKPKKPLLSVIQ